MRADWPQIASILLVPAAMADSDLILKGPIWPVAWRWVPPQSSTEKPPISTTRTTEPYFSPKKAIQFSGFSLKGTSYQLMGEFSMMALLTRVSISLISSCLRASK